MRNLKLAIDNSDKHIKNMSILELKEAKKLSLSIPFKDRQSFFENILKPEVISFKYSITSPEWLMSDFDSPVWDCLFVDIKKTIDFKVVLDDGSFLTDHGNSNLLYTFKYILCIQTHPRFNGGCRLTPKYCASKIRIALGFLDYILIKGDYFKLAEFGLSLITGNDLGLFMTRMQKGVFEGIYEYHQHANQLLRQKGMNVSDGDIEAFLNIHPEALYLPEDNALELTSNEILRARTWIWMEGGYREKNKFKNVLKPYLYSNTLHGFGLNFPIIQELKLYKEDLQSEYLSVPVRSKKSQNVSEDMILGYRRLIRSLRVVSGDEYLGIRDNALDEFEGQKNDSQCDENEGIHRFRSLPGKVVFKAMRDAFEFSKQYENEILESMFDILSEAQKLSKNDKLESMNILVRETVSDTLLELGVKVWGFKGKPNNYYQMFRSNVSLLDLYYVLIGSLQILLGTLMARRAGELYELESECLLPKKINPHLNEHDTVDFCLVFHNRKSGDAGEREPLERPIPRSVAKSVWNFQQFRIRLIKNGIIKKDASLLLSFFKSGGIKSKMDKDFYGRHFNKFCDYFETLTVRSAKGELHRYYIRQHQLRRFFAMCFFWGSGYDGLDTLRWFLGHTDSEHLWNYITEHTPGIVLRGAKAEALVHGLNADSIVGIERLRALLKERFDVGTLTIELLADAIDDLEDDAMSGYVTLDPTIEQLQCEMENNVDTLLMEGVIDLQPTFLTVTNEDGEVVQKVTLVLIVKDIENA